MWRRILNSPIDWLLLLIPILLTVCGIITIYTITYGQSKAGLATSQLGFAIFGLLIMAVVMFSDYRWLRTWSGALYVLVLVLLIPLLPMIASKLPFTVKVFGAYRWINLKFFQLQPGEVFKLVAAVFSASLLANYIGRVNWRRTVSYIIVAVLPVGLILVQPDLGTASVVAAIFAGVFLASRVSGRIIIAILLVVALMAPITWSNLKPYQKKRVDTFLNPSSDPQGQGYNVKQSIIAIGSGGMLGRGFGQGSQTVLNFLPVAHADFIFAGFAEATGFVGSIGILILYLILISRCLAIARESDDNFGQLLAMGIAVKFLFQVAVHIGMNLGLLPVTGIPLPFMSYGGTSLVIDFISIGILQSLHIRHKKIAFR